MILVPAFENWRLERMNYLNIWAKKFFKEELIFFLKF